MSKLMSWDEAADLLLSTVVSFKIKRTSDFYVLHYNQNKDSEIKARSLPELVKKVSEDRIIETHNRDKNLLHREFFPSSWISKQNSDQFIKLMFRDPCSKKESVVWVDYLRPGLTRSDFISYGDKDKIIRTWEYPLDVHFGNALSNIGVVKDKFEFLDNKEKLDNAFQYASERYFMYVRDYLWPFGFYFRYPVFVLSNILGYEVDPDKKEIRKDAKFKIFKHFFNLSYPNMWLGSKDNKNGATIIVDLVPRKSTKELCDELHHILSSYGYEYELIAGEGLPATGELGWGVNIYSKDKTVTTVSCGHYLSTTIKEAINKTKKILK